MKLADLNPVTLASRGINKALNALNLQDQDQNATQPATAPAGAQVPAVAPNTTVTPVEDQAKDAVPVSASEANRALATIDQREQDARTLAIMTAAAQRTEEFRKEAESFDDEKASLGEKGLRVLFSGFAYVVPVALAYVIGQSVGDAFAPSGWSTSYGQYAHFLSIALEMSLPILGFCVSLTFRRAAKDRSQVALCAVFSVLFLLLGIGNAVVQIFMVTQNIGALTPRDQAAVYFRAAAPLIIDLICTLYLSVTGAKSLRRYLADKRAVIEAVRDVSGVNILLEQQEHTAALNQIQAAMDMESKRKRAMTWNKLEALQAEKMIRDTERAMNQDDEGYSSGAYRRRRY